MILMLFDVKNRIFYPDLFTHFTSVRNSGPDHVLVLALFRDQISAVVSFHIRDPTASLAAKPLHTHHFCSKSVT
jgi:hypothetical protein